MKPVVAIVGRPNVGKSRLFNRLVGRTMAIVADQPGITRDRQYAVADWCGREFIVIDTGGLDFDPARDIDKKVSAQSIRAIEDADVVICLFDGQLEPTMADKEVVRRLRVISKPIIFAVNKIDNIDNDLLKNSYYEIGAEELISVSAEHGLGVDLILDEAVKYFKDEVEDDGVDSDVLKVAVVGRPNVGKSTLINRLAGEERVVAHEMPGTTRDAIDVEIEFDGRKYVFIDTAGVKRKFNVAERLEKYTALRSLRTIDRADIVLQLIDAAEGLTKQDLSLTGFINDEWKGAVILVNKWDLSKYEWSNYEEGLRKGMGDLDDLTMIPISASTGYNCLEIFSAIHRITSIMDKKVATSKLNDIVGEALISHHMPVFKGKEVRINYATQTGTTPPTFVLFSNFPAAVPYTYRRYLKRKLQDELGMRGVPIKLIMKRK